MNFFVFGFISIIIYTVIILTTHFIFYFVIKETDFETIFNTFESTPYFNFENNLSCKFQPSLILHTWEGIKIKETSYYYKDGKKKNHRNKSSRSN